MDFAPSAVATPLAVAPGGAVRPTTYQSVQALRAVAAILVAIFHAGLKFDTTQATFSIGNAGVDIFFVISGFVIWTVTTRRPTSPLTFLKHRFLRLVPMYWIMTLAMAGGATFLPSAFPHMHPTASDAILSLLFVPHQSSSADTFEPLLGQGWTLNFEVFFYLIFAVVLLLPVVARFRVMVLALLVLPVLGVFAMTPAIPPTFLLNPLLIEFMGGLCLARLAAGTWRPPVAACWVAVVAGAAFLAFLAAPASGDDAARVVAYGVPAFLIVGGGIGLEAAGRIRLPAWTQLLGASSYSLYLTHTFVISAMWKVWPHDLSHVGFLVAATVVSAIVGVIVYSVLENPLLALMRGKGLPSRATLFAPN
jgi:exopolysaccharide production protein ExoZ